VFDRIGSLFAAAQQAARLILDRAVAVNPWWVAAGVVVYEISQVVRSRGWFNILRAAYPDATGLRARDVTGAYLAGVGLNAVLPARSGDFLKLFMVHRRIPGARYSTLIASFVPETLFESFAGLALVVWALAHGFLPVPVAPNELPQIDVSFIIVHPVLSAAGTAILALGATLFFRWLGPRGRGLGARLRQGVAILRSPRAFVSGVVSWQALARLIRLGGLACFMAAFGLPVTGRTALLVMAAQGAGRIIPIAPVSAGLRIAMLDYGFVEVTDSAVDVASITSFWFIVGAAHLVASLAIALVVIAVTFRTMSPRRALALAREAARSASAHLPTPRDQPPREDSVD
jgi:Lysylphosphatidylglycerol synthase TM region